jgi:Rieske Fe-S protein
MQDSAQIATGTDRRTLLRGVAAVGLAGVAGTALAACGGGSDDDNSGGSTQSSGDSQSSAPAEGSESSTGGGAVALVKTSDVPEGGGTILESEKLVVTQPAAGQFKAFSAVCTHQQCTVGSVKDGLITCPCHGSQYSIEDGSVKRGPAPRALSELPVTVQGDEVVRA